MENNNLADTIVELADKQIKESKEKLSKTRSECCNEKVETRIGYSGTCLMCLKCRNIAPNTTKLRKENLLSGCCTAKLESWKGETGAFLGCQRCLKIPEKFLKVEEEKIS